MAGTRRGFCSCESPPVHLTSESLPSKYSLVGHFRRKYFCLAFICFFSLCTCVHVQGFICLLHWISDFICSSCSFPTWDHVSATVASEPAALRNVVTSCSNRTISARDYAEAPGLIFNNNELIFIELPLVLTKSRKYGTQWQNTLKPEGSESFHWASAAF